MSSCATAELVSRRKASGKHNANREAQLLRMLRDMRTPLRKIYEIAESVAPDGRLDELPAFAGRTSAGQFAVVVGFSVVAGQLFARANIAARVKLNRGFRKRASSSRTLSSRTGLGTR